MSLPLGLRGSGIAVALLLLGGVGTIVWNARLRAAPDPEPLAGSFTYAVDRRVSRSACVPRTDFVAAGEIVTGLTRVDAIASGSGELLAVAGDSSIALFDLQGTLLRRWAVRDPVRCLAVASNVVWAGVGRSVARWTLEGAALGQTPPYATNAVITAIATGGGGLFVADAGTRSVYVCDSTGRVERVIGRRDASKDIPGLVVPSAYLDLAMAADGLLRVVNPGRHQVEAYTVDGDLEATWGKASLEAEGFCGCCNPAYIALLPDGRFVTSEKGLRRVKVYGSSGQFAGVVVGTDELGEGPDPLPIAVDAGARILVVVPGTGKVRVYEHQDRQ